MLREIEKNSIKDWLAELSKVKPKEKNAKLWQYVYKLAAEPRRRRIIVNLTKLEKFGKEGDNIIVPGKVLGGGTIKKGLNITAVEYSAGAAEKIKKSKGKVLNLAEMMKKESVRVII